MEKFSIKSVFLILIIVSNCVYAKSSLNININSGQFNISYDLNSSCDLIGSSTVPSNLKCLMLCQMTTCKSLQFDVSSNNCTLIDSNPSLIKYDSVSGLNLTYILSNRSISDHLIGSVQLRLFFCIFKDSYLNIGDACLFDFTCNNRCFNGSCKCIRDLAK